MPSALPLLYTFRKRKIQRRYSINPVQQLVQEKSTSQTHKTGPNDINITMGKTTIVNEKYTVSSLLKQNTGT